MHPVAVIGLTNCGHSVERFYNIGLSPLTNPGSITDKEIIDDILAINGRERIMSRFFEEARGKVVLLPLTKQATANRATQLW